MLVAVARGMSNTEIADTLFMSPATAKTHVSRLLTKLAARDRAQLVMLAYEAGVGRARHELIASDLQATSDLAVPCEASRRRQCLPEALRLVAVESQTTAKASTSSVKQVRLIPSRGMPRAGVHGETG